MMATFTLGTDGEAFVGTHTGRIRAAQGIVPGEKGNPFKTKHGAVHRDNVLAEFNTKEASTKATFVSNVINAINDLQSIVGEHNCTLVWKPSHYMENKWLLHTEAQIFGCEPDIDAWLIDPGAPVFPEDNLRTAGGHIHVGVDIAEGNDILQYVRAMDLVVGIPSILADEDSGRRALYGRAGHFRVKPYGFEYRVLSNFWYARQDYISRIWDLTASAIKDYAHWATVASSSSYSKLIRHAINTSDKTSARTLISNLGLSTF